MDKKKRKYDRVRMTCLTKTAKEFDISISYVRAIVDGDRTRDDVRKFYQQEYEKLKAVML